MCVAHLRVWHTQTNTITNVMWTDRLRAWYSEHIKGGLVFTHVESKGLFGRAALRGQAVINNDPNNDSMPKGHPRINGVLCIPLICGQHCLIALNTLTTPHPHRLSPLKPHISRA